MIPSYHKNYMAKDCWLNYNEFFVSQYMHLDTNFLFVIFSMYLLYHQTNN